MAAFLLAPAAPVFIVYVLMGLKFGVVILGAPMAYAAELLVGLPVYLWASRSSALSRSTCVVGGLAAGEFYPVLVGGVYAIGNWPEAVRGDGLKVLLQIMVGTGLVAGLVFAAIAGIPATAPTAGPRPDLAGREAGLTLPPAGRITVDTQGAGRDAAGLKPPGRY